MWPSVDEKETIIHQQFWWLTLQSLSRHIRISFGHLILKLKAQVIVTGGRLYYKTSQKGKEANHDHHSLVIVHGASCNDWHYAFPLIFSLFHMLEDNLYVFILFFAFHLGLKFPLTFFWMKMNFAVLFSMAFILLQTKP